MRQLLRAARHCLPLRYQRFDSEVMLMVIVLLAVLVAVIQKGGAIDWRKA